MDKQKALDRLNLMRVWYEDYGTPDADYDAICYAINIIEAQPKELDALIKALEQEHKKLREMQDVPPEKCEKCMMEHLDEMEKLEVELEIQKAQPEIIRCKDCKFWTHIKRTNRYWCKTDDGLYDLNPSPNDFCSRAERRTDEHSD